MCQSVGKRGQGRQIPGYSSLTGASRRVISTAQGKQHRYDSVPVIQCTLVTGWNVIWVFMFRD